MLGRRGGGGAGVMRNLVERVLVQAHTTGQLYHQHVLDMKKYMGGAGTNLLDDATRMEVILVRPTARVPRANSSHAQRL